jgi:hypothetical protein
MADGVSNKAIARGISFHTAKFTSPPLSPNSKRTVGMPSVHTAQAFCHCSANCIQNCKGLIAAICKAVFFDPGLAGPDELLLAGPSEYVEPLTKTHGAERILEIAGTTHVYQRPRTNWLETSPPCRLKARSSACDNAST